MRLVKLNSKTMSQTLYSGFFAVPLRISKAFEVSQGCLRKTLEIIFVAENLSSTQLCKSVSILFQMHKKQIVVPEQQQQQVYYFIFLFHISAF